MLQLLLTLSPSPTSQYRIFLWSLNSSKINYNCEQLLTAFQVQPRQLSLMGIGEDGHSWNEIHLSL